ncbi:hypothetical protein AKJ16_DCAP10337 [Drosera capensis]
MANSKSILVIGFLCALALLIVSEVSARELAESDFHKPDDKPGFKPAGDKPKPGKPKSGKGHPPEEEIKKPGDKPGDKPGFKPGDKPGFKPGDKPGMPKPGGKGHPPKEESKN